MRYTVTVAAGHQLRTPNTPEKQMHNTKRHWVSNVTTQLYFCLLEELPDDIRGIDVMRIREGFKEIVQKATVWEDDEESGTLNIDKDHAAYVMSSLLWDIAEPYTREDAEVIKCKDRLEVVIKKHFVG
jgi:hypothetical protein